MVTLIVQFVTLSKLPPLSITSFGILLDVFRNYMILVGWLLVILTASDNHANFT